MLCCRVVCLFLCAIPALVAQPCPTCHHLPDEKILAEFGESLNIIADHDMGFRTMQNYLNNENDDLIIRTGKFNTREIQQKLIRSVKKKFDERSIMTEKIKKSVLRMATNTRPTATSIYNCCDEARINILRSRRQCVYNSIFKSEVDTSKMCIVERNSSVTEAITVTRDLLDTFMMNKVHYPQSSWQHVHIGTRHFIYPFSMTTQCTHTAFTNRPWYAEATFMTYDMVLVIDRSEIMASPNSAGKTMLDTAKVVAHDIIRRQSHYSSIAVVAFADGVTTARDKGRCYETSMAPATWFNKRIWSEFISSLSGSGKSHYKIGIQKAVHMLNIAISVKPKMIVFITGTPPVEKGAEIRRLMNGIRSKNPNIHVVTIDIAAVDRNVHNILKAMAIVPSSFGKRPLYVKIRPSQSMEISLRPLFEQYMTLPASELVSTYISIPYLCANAKDIVWTVTKPIFFKNKFIGVAAADLLLTELLQEISYFKQTETQYIFMVHQKEKNCLFHPNMPWPTEDKESVNVNLNILEKEATQAGVIASMLEGQSGSMLLPVTRDVSNGDVYREGFRKVYTRASFNWRPVPGLPVSLCIVTDHQDYITFKLHSTPKNVPLGNIEYIKGEDLCVHFRSIVRKKDSSIQLCATAFIDPAGSLMIEETVEDWKKYKQIFEEKVNNTIFQEDVIAEVQVTNVAHDYWVSRPRSLVAISRYVALESGIMRMYPGFWINKRFNPRVRPWYRRATVVPGRTTMSVPYLDANGAGYVLTLSKALVLNGAKRDQVVGVMGIDITLGYFHARLQQRFSKCTDPSVLCFVIDRAGYVLVHNALLEPPRKGPQPQIEYVHITSLEPNIAYDLIENGLLLSQACHDLSTMQKYHMYNMAEKAMVKRFDDYPYYELGYVPHSNVYVIIKRKRILRAVSKKCHCLQSNNTWPPCIKNVVCQCPCVDKVGDFQYCKNNFSSSWSLCDEGDAFNFRFKTFKHVSTKETIAKLQSLQPCDSYNCDQYKNRLSCELVAGCKWCLTDEHGDDLKKSYCGQHHNCYFGQESFPSPYGVTLERPEPFCGSSCKLIIIFVVLSAFMVIFIVVIYATKDRICDAFNKPMLEYRLSQEEQRMAVLRSQSRVLPISAADIAQAYSVSRPGSQLSATEIMLINDRLTADRSHISAPLARLGGQSPEDRRGERAHRRRKRRNRSKQRHRKRDQRNDQDV